MYSYWLASKHAYISCAINVSLQFETLGNRLTSIMTAFLRLQEGSGLLLTVPLTAWMTLSAAHPRHVRPPRACWDVKLPKACSGNPHPVFRYELTNACWDVRLPKACLGNTHPMFSHEPTEACWDDTHFVFRSGWTQACLGETHTPCSDADENIEGMSC